MVKKLKDIFKSNLFQVQLIFILFLLFWTQFQSVQNLRFLISDTSAWILFVLKDGAIHVDALRYTSSLLLMPALLIRKIFPMADGVDLVLLSTGLIMTMHHFLSLYISYKILKSANKLFYFAYPLYSFVGLNMLAAPWAGSQVHEIGNLFWPIYFGLMFLKLTKKTAILIGLGILALGFSHQGAIFVLIIILMQTVLLLKKSNSTEENKKYKIFFILSLISVLSCILRTLGIEFKMNDGFVRFFFQFRSHFYQHAILIFSVMIAGLIVIYDFIDFGRRHTKAMILVGIVGYWFLGKYDLYNKYDYIHFKISITYLLPILSFFLFIKLNFFSKTTDSKKSYMVFPIFVLAILVFIRDQKIHREWESSTAYLNELYIKQNSNCIQVSKADEKNKEINFNYDMLNPVEYKSILLNRSRFVKTIAHSEKNQFNCRFIKDYKYVPYLDANSLLYGPMLTQKRYFEFLLW